MSDDPYVDPRTGVLRNRLGIAGAGELTHAQSVAPIPDNVGDSSTGDVTIITIVLQILINRFDLSISLGDAIADMYHGRGPWRWMVSYPRT